MKDLHKDAPTKANEKARAKGENETNRAKQRLEKRESPQSHPAAQNDSGVDGGETFPSTTVVPSQPPPWENPDNAAMGERYTRRPKDADKPKGDA